MIADTFGRLNEGIENIRSIHWDNATRADCFHGVEIQFLNFLIVKVRKSVKTVALAALNVTCWVDICYEKTDWHNYSRKYSKTNS